MMNLIAKHYYFYLYTMYETLCEETKFMFDYFGKNTPSSHFTRSGIVACILNRQSSPNVLISIDRRRTHPGVNHRV